VADLVTLTIGGRRFDGWKTVSIERSLDALSASFELGLTDRWEGQPDRWEIETGAPCEVFIGGDQVVTGYIDGATYEIDGETRSITVRGRDRTADLFDCSAIHTPGSWKARKLEQIAADLLKPFGLTARALAPTGAAFDKFALQQGESVFEVITRLCRQRGLLAITNEAGELLFTVPGSTAAGYSLELGINIEALKFTNDAADRFSDYHLKGYSRGGDASRPKASAKDAGVRRYRPLLIINDEAASAASLASRAKWEATVRAGQAQQVEAVVSGWRDANGSLYRIDRLAPVRARLAGVDDTLLVSGVAFTLDSTGSRTRLSLVRKEAFSQEPIPAQARKGGAIAPLTRP
jgi:prophage tail gpP-like protein